MKWRAKVCILHRAKIIPRLGLTTFVDPTQINWLQVATRLSARNNKDCRKRWVYTLAPTVKKGAWDEQEDNALREGTRIHGTKWSEVARVVGTRQPDRMLPI